MDDEIEAEEARLDAEAAAAREHRAVGELELRIDVDEEDDMGDEGATRDPAPAQFAAVEFLRASEATLRPAILQAIADHYLKERDKLVEFYQTFAEPEEIKQELPKEMSAEEVDRRVRFSSVNIDRRERDGLAYVRLDGGCSWEEEHGISVTLHGDRIVGVDQEGESVVDEA